ncbi:hypothetical protein DY000_02023557 [Brassica cretica]|uniref:Uncharacterized protein n=1 Tax=Brassica cretica TaxID=69181 RepID=A0ABQ7E3L2_BRACR|nr:hypothetical protein DY000_02023557 [Brassica cretica]
MKIASAATKRTELKSNLCGCGCVNVPHLRNKQQAAVAAASISCVFEMNNKLRPDAAATADSASAAAAAATA